MERAQVLSSIANELKNIIPELENLTIAPTDSLKELGANSLERFEILTNVMCDNNINVSLTDFSDCKSIDDILNIMCQESN